jgi:hydrogenase maturation protein HypF
VIRLAINVQGIVQGVGFRPFVYQTAAQRGLSGWVRNRTNGVCMEIQGSAAAVHDFLTALRRDAPPAVRIAHIDAAEIAAATADGFRILDSVTDVQVRPTLPADQATCRECRAEIESPGARRARYPFTNCTRCGPRYTIIETLPYDRPRTTMRQFPLCAACAAEYDDPCDRRFHAQPIACPTCGPALRLLLPDRQEIAREETALQHAAESVRSGQILALKGLGGFQLLVDATNPDAVTRLRRKKGREEKPFAVMFPSLDAVRASCAVSDLEADMLSSPESPIVLLERQQTCVAIATAVAPGTSRLGALLPYTPLHQLLLAAVARPVVCTSGNLSEEPMRTDETDARRSLGGVADRFLTHDRPIVRAVDDSVVQVGPLGVQILRRARGFAPLPLLLVDDSDSDRERCVLALGGHLKNTIALATGGEVIVSQHLGDLSSFESTLLLERTVTDVIHFFHAQPECLACDVHPDYVSTQLAERLAVEWNVAIERVQHHHAHVAACVAEYGLRGPVLGLTWDGAGLGTDGLLWGGEALVVDGATFQRIAHLRPFALPGGEQALREPCRAALGLLHEIFGERATEHVSDAFSSAEMRILLDMLQKDVCVARTTSIGRLFDAVAALTGMRYHASYEGQAATELEFAAGQVEEQGNYTLPLSPGKPAVADWEPLVRAVVRDRNGGVPAPIVAARFHNTLTQLAEQMAERAGLSRVVLTGGCFQNRRLVRTTAERLQARGFEVYTPRRYPPNDGGLSLGQVWVATRTRKE